MDKRLKELSDYRLEQAERCIRSAKILASDSDYKGAANRSYYAIFHYTWYEKCTCVRGSGFFKAFRSICIFSEAICENRNF